MKALNIVFIIMFLLIISCGKEETPAPLNSTANQEGKYECYICTGGSSKRYHKHKNCNGIESCKAEIIGLSKAEAEKKGRTPCKKCY